MDSTVFLYSAIAVFVLMIIGLVLTALEFSRGDPAEQDEMGPQNPAEIRPVPGVSDDAI